MRLRSGRTVWRQHAVKPDQPRARAHASGDRWRLPGR